MLDPDLTSKAFVVSHRFTRMSVLTVSMRFNTHNLKASVSLNLRVAGFQTKCSKKFLESTKKAKNFTKNCSELGGVDLMTGLLDDDIEILTQLFLMLV